MIPIRLFHSKAETLAHLSVHEDLHIPPLMFFTVGEWRARPTDVECALREQAAHWQTERLAVRSSCLREDGEESSGAGAFTSRLNVPLPGLPAAIGEVIASYGEAAPEDQVLVQPMLHGIVLNGVLMTRVLADGAPYFVINYDESGRTDTVTGGLGASKTVFVLKSAKADDFDSPRLRRIVELARRLEELCSSDALDIEFCQDASGLLRVLQVRPICTQTTWAPDVAQQVRTHVGFISGFLRARMARRPGLYGDSTILGVMPDWNPAEIIGLTPRRLASSLYRECITRNTWRNAREAMGYRTLPPEELMVLVAGRPYIDVRVSLNSFLPAGIDKLAGEALVSAWLDRLDRNPALHDKLEFEVAQTCLDFCFDAHMDARYPDALTRSRREDFRVRLQGLTRTCMDTKPKGTLTAAFDAIAELRGRQAALTPPAASPATPPLPQVARLLEECRTFGTLPFSILARHAFIAESLLRTAVEREALTPERLVQFKQSLRTVTSEFAADFDATAEGKLSRESFMCKYGHLRPSTYDILSPCYAERRDLFGHEVQRVVTAHAAPAFAFTPDENWALGTLLAEAGLPDSVGQLAEYARKAITGRELAKFVFSRHVSAILDWLVFWGEGLGLDRAALSFLDVRDILEWETQSLLRAPQSYFSELAEQGRRLLELGRSLKLGYLLRSPRDVAVVAQHRSAPNFVGKGRVEAPVQLLTADSSCAEGLDGCIACIENADPGFDWIFTRRIVGLVTMFGGSNSHMTIRCAEYGLPAAIGVGEALFAKVTETGRCLLYPDNSVLRPLTAEVSL